jgi:hypothetical protein
LSVGWIQATPWVVAALTKSGVWLNSYWIFYLTTYSSFYRPYVEMPRMVTSITNGTGLTLGSPSNDSDLFTKNFSSKLFDSNTIYKEFNDARMGQVDNAMVDASFVLMSAYGLARTASQYRYINSLKKYPPIPDRPFTPRPSYYYVFKNNLVKKDGKIVLLGGFFDGNPLIKVITKNPAKPKIKIIQVESTKAKPLFNDPVDDIIFSPVPKLPPGGGK